MFSAMLPLNKECIYKEITDGIHKQLNPGKITNQLAFALFLFEYTMKKILQAYLNTDDNLKNIVLKKLHLKNCKSSLNDKDANKNNHDTPFKNLLCYLFYALLIGPIIEEIVFRGTLTPVFKNLYPHNELIMLVDGV